MCEFVHYRKGGTALLREMSRSDIAHVLSEAGRTFLCIIRKPQSLRKVANCSQELNG